MISKKLFIETIKAIKKQIEHDRKCAEALGIVYEGAFVANIMYNNRHLSSAIMNLLEDIMQDRDTCWIEYFIWDKDFGRKDLKAYRKDGSEIDLSTPGKLYDFLIENLKEKE